MDFHGFSLTDFSRVSPHKRERNRRIFSRKMTDRNFCDDPVPGRCGDFFCFSRSLEKIAGCLLVVCIITYFTLKRVDPVTRSPSSETMRIYSPFGRTCVARTTEKRLPAGEPLATDNVAASSGCQ
jgi:hypothetical protein